MKIYRFMHKQPYQTRLYDAHAELLDDLDRGYEFPDAAARAAVNHGVKVDDLREIFDDEARKLDRQGAHRHE